MNQGQRRSSRSTLKRLSAFVCSGALVIIGLTGCGGSGGTLADAIGIPITTTYYAIAAEDGGPVWAARSGSTASAAEQAALNACGSSRCRVLSGAAYTNCGALAIDNDGTNYFRTGSSRNAVVSSVLNYCRSEGGVGCRIDSGDSGREAVFGSC